MDPYVFKRLWRRPWLSLCSLILSLVLCFLVGYLTSYRQAQQAKLKETQESFDILCVVTDRRGTKSTGLRMGSMAHTFVTDADYGIAEYVRDLRVTKEFYFTAPEVGIMSVSGIQPLITGISNERCVERLDPAVGGSATYLVDDFYERADYVCLVSEEIYGRLEDDIITLHITDPVIDPSVTPDLGTGSMEFQVVGYYPGGSEDMYMPFEASQILAAEVSNRLTSDSISFLAVDNQNLEAISADAAEVFGSVDPMASENTTPRLALTIHDEQYRATVAALEQNIERTGYLLPIVLLLGLGVGFLISFLATRNESRAYALMRTLGMTRGKLFFSILREQLLLVLLAALGALAITREPIPTVIYFIFYSIGCVVSVIKSIQVPPTAILRQQE